MAFLSRRGGILERKFERRLLCPRSEGIETRQRRLIDVAQTLFGDRKTPVAHQGGDASVAAAESAVSLGGIHGVTRRQDVGEESRGDGFIIESTRFEEGFSRVCG